MNKLLPILLTGAFSIAAGLLIFLWLEEGTAPQAWRRVPRIAEQSRGSQRAALSLADTFHESVDADRTTPSLSREWPRFRGPDADNIRRAGPPLTDDFSDLETRVRWRLELGEGHAGAAVFNGRVYVLDYDEERRADILRCFDFADGSELWRTGYPVAMKRNHGYSRTVPAVTADVIISIGPRCHVMACETQSGEPIWVRDMVAEFATEEPLWYTAQCPLIDGDTLVLAPAGEDVLMTGLDLRSGEVRWTVSNPQGWQMSHSSVVLVTLQGRRQYVYAAVGGVVSVSAEPGSVGTVLWRSSAWNNRVVAPCPLPLDDQRLLLTSGHAAGSLILHLERAGQTWTVKEGQRFAPDELASEQQTPVFYGQHLFSVLPKDGGANRMELISATPAGKVVWTSGDDHRFGLGPYVIADEKLFAMDDGGRLSVYDVGSPGKPVFRDSAEVLPGPEAWAPIAVAGGYLILRDNRRMVCLDLRRQSP